MFCELQYRMVRRLGGALLHATKNKTQTHQLTDEVQLNCVSLRPRLDYEVEWSAVKGQDERQKPAPLTALHATREVTAMSEKKIRRAATSALTFMTFS
jgi:hypothetical protein